MDLTGLQPNTTYFYRLYDGDGTGCATNYRATASAEGSFATPPCARATAPTQPATQAAATAAGYTVTKSKIEGSCYEVYAKDKDGKKFELFYNPVDLQLVKKQDD